MEEEEEEEGNKIVEEEENKTVEEEEEGYREVTKGVQEGYKRGTENKKIRL